MAVIIAVVLAAIVAVVGLGAAVLDRRPPATEEERARSMNRHLAVAAILWVVFTALAVLGTAAMNPFPTVGAPEAEFSDHAFRLMTYMGSPIFGLVLAGLVYSILQWRSAGPADGMDGAPLKGTGMVPKVWLVATSALAVTVMIYPGLTGLAEMRRDQTSDMTIKVTGQRWSWNAAYPQGFDSDELVLPVNKRVKFEVTAPDGDVLHSFWVPAFRNKIDAVPGMVTTSYVTPTVLGDGKTDASFRVQCAELCGLFHARMAMNVRVVDAAEY
ncbi:MAG: cytochrome c oxidase subunit II, partial [Dehalococcoidia bacterium]